MRRVLAVLVAGARALCRYGTLAAFAVLIGVVLLQVLGRVPGIRSPAWTEEVARFALVYLVAFSCGLALLRGELVNVDLFVAPLSERARRVVDRFVDVVVLVFSLAIIPGAWDYVVGSFGERARSIDLPMVGVYVVALIIPVSLAFFSIARLLGFAPTGQIGQPEHYTMERGELV
ncbi:TRAP transporter small permease [Azospirillum rugosum]|uniref:TRAP transporter small permease protein n=1 Tax=Azospirillum rugosum TaxID=416170 RepID=A0ABS4SXC8_9PROT|nr:TRAP transporter small permease subunit [Azospirillum rugosum]MBP2297212.1 TRAP-type C4-dicarboxylate transport system permease small subunit [Azospirillum rugosum]MDQ0531054.1 TRAP-type C4-dicarboxylate transport system permease small subunit [Azospirillum rugosum]